jgi:prevent-host-death family protein
MTKVNAAKAREQLPELMDRARVQHERIVFTRHDKKIAALVSIEDYELLERLEDEADAASAKRAREEIKKTGTVPWSETKKRMQK